MEWQQKSTGLSLNFGTEQCVTVIVGVLQIDNESILPSNPTNQDLNTP